MPYGSYAEDLTEKLNIKISPKDKELLYKTIHQKFGKYSPPTSVCRDILLNWLRMNKEGEHESN